MYKLKSFINSKDFKTISIYQPPNLTQYEGLQYWEIYFNFSYYLLLLPFRFKFNPATGYYEIHTNIIQKILRLIILSLTGLYFLLNLRYKYLEKVNSLNPTVYFELAYYFFDTFYLIIIFTIFGFNSKGLERIFDQLQTQQRLSNIFFITSQTGLQKVRIFSITVCSLCLATTLLYLIEILDTNHWEINAWISYFSSDGKNIFRSLLCTAQNNSSIGNNENGVLIKLLGTFSFVSNVMEKILNAFSDILFVMTVLLFRKLALSLKLALAQENCCEENNISPCQILLHYKWLKDITETLNNVMGLISFSFVVGNLPFYATNVFDIFRNCNIFLKARYCFYGCYFFPGLVLAAKSSKDADDIKTWLWKEKNYTQIDQVKLSVIFHEVSHSSIGLSSFGCLAINFGLVGSIISVILTYAMLKSQFQSN